MPIGFLKVRDAWLAGQSKRVKNDETDGYYLTYHGNAIAWWDIDPSKPPVVTLAGWRTPTTIMRVNLVLAVFGDTRRIFTRQFTTYIDRGVEIGHAEKIPVAIGPLGLTLWRIERGLPALPPALSKAA